MCGIISETPSSRLYSPKSCQLDMGELHSIQHLTSYNSHSLTQKGFLAVRSSINPILCLLFLPWKLCPCILQSQMKKTELRPVQVLHDCLFDNLVILRQFSAQRSLGWDRSKSGIKARAILAPKVPSIEHFDSFPPLYYYVNYVSYTLYHHHTH